MSTQRRGSGGGQRAATGKHRFAPYDSNRGPRERPPPEEPPEESYHNVGSDVNKLKRKGKHFYDCRHTLDCHDEDSQWLNALPKVRGDWRRLWDDGEILHRRVHSNCKMCDMADMILIPVWNIYTRNSNDGGPSYQSKIQDNRLPVQEPPRENCGLSSIGIDYTGNLVIDILRELAPVNRPFYNFIEKWPAATRIHHWNGDAGQVPVIQWHYPINDVQRAVLTKRLEDAGIGDWAQYALGNCWKGGGESGDWWPGDKHAMDFAQYDPATFEADPTKAPQSQTWPA
ncbi:MAG: hypothetical protein Q9160_008250 [Pyrenula sp. 1 TL-2023]